MITLPQLLKAMVEQNASDLHVTTGTAPVMRINGKLVRVKTDALTGDTTKELCYSILTDLQKARFEENKEIDLSFGLKGITRFRANIFYQKGDVAGSFRKIPFDVPDYRELGLPGVVGDLTKKKNGLVLITGPTGSGKTTSLASLIDKINQEEYGHIITIEDPIEYVHSHKNCIVNQREITVDTDGFRSALKYLLRQDPDYALIGELRDIETMETALNVAETGHLVFATLHTNSAVHTIDRVVSMFPGDQQERIKNQLSFVIQAVVCQDLLPAIAGGVVLACEVMIPNPAIRNLIRENKIHQIYSQMQMGQNQTGMMTMNQSLMSLLVRRKIALKVAFDASPDPEELDAMLKRAGV